MGNGKLYTNEGWLDIEYLASLGCWCNAIIGPRQVGKTFGTIKYLLDNKKYFMYMRRTADELDVISEDPDLNPFKDMEQCGYHVDLQRKGKGWIHGHVDIEDESRPIIEKTGIAIPLSRIAKIRGFSGQQYSDLVFDEFIPEKMVVVRKTEGDAFRNALITIEGNRTKIGKPPLRVWLLANANDLFSPLMFSMNLIPIVETMTRQKEEMHVTDSGICVVLPASKDIISDRMSDPILRHLNDDSAFGKMAFGNQFGYNDTALVKPKSIKGWKPLACIANYYLWGNKEAIYVCRSPHHAGPAHLETEDEKIRFNLMYPEMKIMYRVGRITFSDAELLYKFKQYIGID